MGKMPIKCHYAIILIALLSQFVFATVSNLSVSPYIKTGYSMSLSVRTGGLTDSRIDTRISDGNVIYRHTYEQYFFNPDIKFAFGIREKIDISFFIIHLSFFPREELMSFFPRELRVNVNLFDKEKENALFKNIGLSVFGGLEIALIFSESTAGNAYLGASVGTKKIFNPNRSMELWTSPMIVACYSKSSEDPDYVNPPTVMSLNIPIAARVFFGERTKFSVKAGIDIMIPLSNSKEDTYEYYNNNNDIIHRFVEMDFFPLTAALEFGVHFRSKKERMIARKKMKQKLLLE